MSDKYIKIFKMNDCEWYAGETVQHCVEEMKITMGIKITDDYTEAKFVEEFMLEPCELSEALMNKLIFIDDIEAQKEGWTRKTFKQKLTEMIDAKEKFPTPFATTEW